MFKELIWVKKNSLSESFCKEMIEKFEVDPYRVKGKVDQNNPRVDTSIKITMDMGVTTNIAWKNEDKVLFKALETALDEYEIHLEKISKDLFLAKGHISIAIEADCQTCFKKTLIEIDLETDVGIKDIKVKRHLFNIVLRSMIYRNEKINLEG